MSEGIIADDIDIDIHDERRRQDAKWGDQSGNSPTVWSTVLSEECGEVAEAALHVQFSTGPAEWIEWGRKLREELVQVAAVAHAWIEALDGNAG